MCLSSSDNFTTTIFSAWQSIFHNCTCIVGQTRQKKLLLTAGLRNAGISGKLKFIAFNYLCSRGQRSAPKPRTSQARGTLPAMLNDRKSRQFVKSSGDCPSWTFPRDFYFGTAFALTTFSWDSPALTFRKKNIGQTIVQQSRQRFLTIFSLTVLFFCCLTIKTFSKGCSGKYYISGTAYSTDKAVLKNSTLTVKFGYSTKSILTDSNGHFEIELAWTNACPSRRTAAQHKQDNEKINPKFIYISYSDNEIKLKNKWEKYAYCFPDSKDETTWKKDLYFSNGWQLRQKKNTAGNKGFAIMAANK